MRLTKILPFLAFVFMTTTAEDCGMNQRGSKSKSDEQQSVATEQLTQQKNAEVGMPAITNFTESKLVKMLYELRDQADFATYTYTINMNGDRKLLCRSIGYGIPYAVQFSNPLRTVYKSTYGIEQLPQAEPNGLFMPDALSATWVMCADPEGKGVRPVYVEPLIVVSPFALSN